MKWSWQAVFDAFPELLKGVPLTIELVLFSAILGLFFGLLLALARLSSNKLLSGVSFLYIYFFRGTPLLVQMFLVYHGLGQLEFIKGTWAWDAILSEAFWCAIIAFTMNTSAYIAEIIRGAIQAIPEGELEAADAIGMSSWQKLTRITLPRAFGIMLPAYSNEVIFMLKGSSLAMTITLMEVTGYAKTLSLRNLKLFEVYFAAAIIYLVLTWIILFGFKMLEKRASRHTNYVPPDVETNTVTPIIP